MRLDCFLCSVIQISSRGDGQSGFLNDLLGIINISPFQSHNKRNLEFNRLASIDNSISDGSTVDNSTKHIDKDRLDLVILGDDTECLLDLMFLNTASNIQEVGGFSSVQLDDVHGGHGEAGTIDQTPDVPVQLDVVEAVLGSLHLPGVRLGRVLHLKYMFLSEGSIVIKSKLGISSVNLTLRSFREWVDLQLETVDGEECFVQVLDLFRTLTHQRAREAEELGQLRGHGGRHPGVDVHRHLLDPLRGLLGHLLDVDPAVGAGDDHGSVALPVHQDAEVGLPGDVNSLGHHHLAHWNSSRWGLLGRQFVSNHGSAEFSNLAGVFGKMNSSLESAVKCSLASSTSQHLGLDDILCTWEVSRNFLCLVFVSCHPELLNSDAEILKQTLGLIFQKIEIPALDYTDCRSRRLQQFRCLSHLGHGFVKRRHGFSCRSESSNIS